MNKIKSKCFSEGQVLINLPKLHTWKNISNHFLSNSLVQGNIVLGERKPCGGYRSWFLQYPIFQTSCKTVSELIQTYYFWALGLTSRKRALGGRIYYCPTTPTPPLQERPNRNVSLRILRTFLLGLFANDPLFFGNPDSTSIGLACLKVTSFAFKQSSWITFTIFFFFFFPQLQFISSAVRVFLLWRNLYPEPAWACFDLGYQWYQFLEIKENIYLLFAHINCAISYFWFR